MKTWYLYLLWLLTGGNNTSATDGTVSRGENPSLDDDHEHDDFECDEFEFDDSGFEDFEGDEGLLH